ncbi:PREDICTED: uncharacterized protein LOC108368337 [Rhagoletis zephyria]|uniref:uncharacterized protein LOC108368337 n=1 Tax=Rhagoletis zephyria TaxID=28612 RepID=UPI0008112C47|nr:PREDICTED: uncharacterized protein LOC108368337 [Rhagoletis zephyria]
MATKNLAYAHTYVCFSNKRKKMLPRATGIFKTATVCSIPKKQGIFCRLRGIVLRFILPNVIRFVDRIHLKLPLYDQYCFSPNKQVAEQFIKMLRLSYHSPPNNAY